MVENNYGTHPPLLLRHLTLQNLRNINFILVFSKQSIPGLFYLEPHRKVSATTLELRATNFKNSENNQAVFKPCFFAEFWVSKTRDLSPASPRGVYISRKDPPEKKTGKLHKHQKSSFFDKMIAFFVTLFEPDAFLFEPKN